MSMDMLPDPAITYILEVTRDEKLAEATAIIEDYFTNDTEGWARGYQEWRDRALKYLGRPTSKELRERKVERDRAA